MLFIIIHQVYELWFKQVLWELDEGQARFFGGDDVRAIATLQALRTIIKTLVGQLDILETMTPLSFAGFRDRLDTASGFQSVQFRELEFVLGYKRPEMLKSHRGDPRGPPARLERRLDEPSVDRSLLRFPRTAGVEIPAGAARQGPATSPTVRTRPSRAACSGSTAKNQELAILFEMMTDLDEGLQEWRYRHVKIVERTIGNKHGTGGSLGVEFLKKSAVPAGLPRPVGHPARAVARGDDLRHHPAGRPALAVWPGDTPPTREGAARHALVATT